MDFVIQPLSDIHLDHWRYEPPVRLSADVDVLACAGDIGPDTRGLEWISRLRDRTAPKAEILYVLGNHEPYGHEIHATRQRIQRIGRLLGIHVLDPGTITLGGLRFVGCTLWSDFSVLNRQGETTPQDERRQACIQACRAEGIDSAIAVGRHRFDPEDALGWWGHDVTWLAEVLQDPAPTCVITHHAPIPAALTPAYDGDITNGAFASDLTALITAFRPQAWIHGHVHWSHATRCGATPVLANPLGYRLGENPGWQPDLCLVWDGSMLRRRDHGESLI